MAYTDTNILKGGKKILRPHFTFHGFRYILAESADIKDCKFTDVVTTQTDGSKAHCIAELLKKGYDKENVIMCGDAEGDLKAAETNGVTFYPILVNSETESWLLIPDFLRRFVNDKKSLDVAALRKAFYKNLHVGD